MEQKTTRSRIVSLDLLRVVSCFLVILLHQSGRFVSEMSEYPSSFVLNSWNLGNVFFSLSRCCVPVFVMLSGTFMLDPDREVDGKKIFSKVCSIIRLFLFWSVFYYLFQIIRNTILHKAIDDFSVKTIITSILSGYGHMWFLYLIGSLYVLTPIFRRITKDEKVCWYYLLLSMITTILAPLLIKVPPFDYIESCCDFSLVTGYSFYYVLGFALKRYFTQKPITKKTLWLSLFLFFGSVIVCVIYTYLENKGTMELQSTLKSNMSITTMIESISLYSMSVYLGKNYNLPKSISKIASYTMGIYLSHMFFLSTIDGFLNYYGIKLPIIISIIGVPVIVFSCCFLFSFLLSKNKVSKHLVVF